MENKTIFRIWKKKYKNEGHFKYAPIFVMHLNFGYNNKNVFVEINGTNLIKKNLVLWMAISPEQIISSLYELGADNPSYFYSKEYTFLIFKSFQTLFNFQ